MDRDVVLARNGENPFREQPIPTRDDSRRRRLVAIVAERGRSPGFALP